MSEKKEYSCENLGCRCVFNWPMQLARHAKCLKPPQVDQKKYILRNGVYICLKRDKSFNHQSNIIHHGKKCNGKRTEKNEYRCDKNCSKTFSCMSPQGVHLESDLENVMYATNKLKELIC